MNTQLQAAKPCVSERVQIHAPDRRHAIGVRSSDMDVIKRLSRKIIPEIKPGKRMEFLARAFGYKSAIAMRSSLSEAEKEDIYLVPSIAPLDDFRRDTINEVLSGSAITQQVSDRLSQCAPLVVSGLELTRGSYSTLSRLNPEAKPVFNPGIAQLFAQVNKSHLGLSTRSDRAWGPYFPDLTLPDLRNLEFGCWRFFQGGSLFFDVTFPGEDYVEVVSVAAGSPSRTEIQTLGAAVAGGDIRQKTFSAAACYLDEPVYEEHRVSFTLLSRSASGNAKAFMSVTFEVGTACVDDEEHIREQLHKAEGEELTQDDLNAYRCSNWDVAIEMSGYGVFAKDREMEEMGDLYQALYQYYYVFFGMIGDAANKGIIPVIIRVLPDEGPDFGYLTFDYMLNGVRTFAEIHSTGEFIVHETEDDLFSIVMLEP